ncbi:MAG TPA: methyltransferase domain-containing protein, partial [Nitrococcus sp.]|nr:methyltransferase domain-containing protein [Nitrococcus sp.]
MVDTMLDASQANITQETVKQYYGQILQSREDLKAGACCTDERLPEHLAAILRQIHPQVRERFYGCGSPLPPALAGCTVLDLGCGSGRDCYLLSKLVGATGRVIGIDMTDEQLAVALRHQVYHAQVFGYAASNVDFRKGYIEDLAGLSIPDASVDVVVSNCVINLSPDKPTVFQEIFRVLK